jgi:NNP family nitrate/nitrite transporter-like MFS transporter
MLYVGVSACMFIVSSLPPVALVVPMLFLAMGMLGMGNGSVFQMAPQRFPQDIELTTGIVGAAGGLGGFFLPSAIGALKDISGSFGVGICCFALLVLAGALLLLELGVSWSFTWREEARRHAMVFSYRNPRRRQAQTPVPAELQPAEE